MLLKIKKNPKLLLLVSLIVIFLGASFLYQNSLYQTKESESITTVTESNIQHPTEKNLDPIQTVDAFYRWYLNNDGNALDTDSFSESQLISNRLKEIVSPQLKTESSFQTDPFTLTEILPESFVIDDSKVEEQLATVEISFFTEQLESFREVNLILTDGQWKIDQVQIIDNISKPTNNEDSVEVKIYFNDISQYPEDEGFQCEQVFGFTRNIPTTTDLETKIKLTLNELFKGPTAKEKERGATSTFSDSTTQLLNEVKVIDKTAYLDFIDAVEVLAGNNSSCGGSSLIAQIENTVKQNFEIEKVVMSNNGNAEDFYLWLQLGCEEENNYCQTVFEQTVPSH